MKPTSSFYVAFDSCFSRSISDGGNAVSLCFFQDRSLPYIISPDKKLSAEKLGRDYGSLFIGRIVMKFLNLSLPVNVPFRSLQSCFRRLFEQTSRETCLRLLFARMSEGKS